jgi:hypothetical protein
MSNFDTDSNGMIQLCPVTGWTGFVPYGLAVGLRLEFVRSEKALLAGQFEAVQLVLQPAQATELAELLLKKVAQAQSGGAPGSERQ